MIVIRRWKKQIGQWPNEHYEYWKGIFLFGFIPLAFIQQ